LSKISFFKGIVSLDECFFSRSFNVILEPEPFSDVLCFATVKFLQFSSLISLHNGIFCLQIR
jgi:hypothetical protein